MLPEGQVLMMPEDAYPPVGVGAEVADVLRAAYYYALTDGRRVVVPSQLLVAAARNDDRAARLLGPKIAEARTAIPMREDQEATVAAGPSGAGYAGVLREASWWVRRANPAPACDIVPVWSGSVGAALVRSTDLARAAGVSRLDVPHLLLGLLDPAEPSVTALTERVGVTVAAVRRQIGAADLGVEPAPFVPLIDAMRVAGAAQSRGPWLVRWIPALVARFTSREARWGGPILACLEREVMRQTVLVGHDVVQSSSVLLAIVSLDVQLGAVGERLRTPFLPHNQGGRLLIEAGFDFTRAQSVAELLAEVERETLPVSESATRFWDTGRPGDPLWSTAAVRNMDQATSIARECGHHDAGTSHLLAAALQEGGAAARLLTNLSLDKEELLHRVLRSIAES